jgi:hypothetical protein
MARVPQDLADRVQRYAGLHRQTISDVLRDGLLVLLQEEDPYRQYVSDANTASDIVSDSIPSFDSSKYVLGKLCPRGHDYHGTEQSLLRRSNRHCLACDREKFHERKQAKRPK